MGPSDRSASLAEFVERIGGPTRTVTVYGPELDADLRGFLDDLQVDVVQKSLPVPGSSGYLTVRRGDEYLGSVPRERAGTVSDVGNTSPWDADSRASVVRALVELLCDTSFVATGRASLLATSREFEDRAWRVGEGRLDAGFQRLSSLQAQLPVYERLAAESDLSVTVYGEPDWTPPASADLSFVTGGDGDLGRYWFVAFDGGGDDDMACALLAVETAPGTFEGGWTYDADVTDELFALVDERYGDSGEHNG